jgi:hypothetical protein
MGGSADRAMQGTHTRRASCLAGTVSPRPRWSALGNHADFAAFAIAGRFLSTSVSDARRARFPPPATSPLGIIGLGPTLLRRRRRSSNRQLRASGRRPARRDLRGESYCPSSRRNRLAAPSAGRGVRARLFETVVAHGSLGSGERIAEPFPPLIKG